jgi:hypothetical protein
VSYQKLKKQVQVFDFDFTPYFDEGTRQDHEKLFCTLNLSSDPLLGRYTNVADAVISRLV